MCRDPYCGPVANAVDPVIGKFLQCFYLAAGDCFDANISASQLVRKEDFDEGYVLIPPLCDSSLDMGLRLRGFIARRLCVVRRSLIVTTTSRCVCTDGILGTCVFSRPASGAPLAAVAA